MTYQTNYNETSKTWHGQTLEPIYNMNGSLGAVILNALARCPKKIGQISDNNGVQLTNREIRLRSIRTAQNLLKLGFKQGDIFAFVAQNNHNLAPLVFGSIVIGAAVGTLDGSFKDAELSHFIQNSKPTLILCDNSLVDRLKKIVADLNLSPSFVSIDDERLDFIRPVSDLFQETGTENTFIIPNIGDSSKAIAGIVTSSGTTGMPKGVCITHANMLSYSCLTNYTAEDVVMSETCISWISAFKTLIGGTISNSLRVITTEFCTAELSLSIIEKYGVTNLAVSTTSLALILQNPTVHATNLGSVQTTVCGGSSVYLELIQLFRKIMPTTTRLVVVYGLSEACGAFSRNLVDLDLPQCVGYLVPNACVTIVNEAGQRCEIGEIGDIRFKMMRPFLGYYGEDHLTKDAFDGDGFVRTGDIGYFDEADRLFVVDRQKDMIIYNCNHVSPTEIESVIITHIGVVEVCVVGVPDITFSELPTAVIVKNKAIDVTEKEIEDLVREKMFEWKHLYGGVYFVNKLPKTSSGKVKRRTVREMAIEMRRNRNKREM